MISRFFPGFFGAPKRGIIIYYYSKEGSREGSQKGSSKKRKRARAQKVVEGSKKGSIVLGASGASTD